MKYSIEFFTRGGKLQAILMTIDTLIMLFGAFVILEPQLGFPTNWDAVLLFVAGTAIVGLGIAVRRRGLREPSRAPNTEQANGGV